MLRHAGAVLGTIVMVGCASENGQPDAAAPVDAQVDAVAAVAADAAVDLAPDAPRGSHLLADRRQVDFGVFYLGCPGASSQVMVVNFAGDATRELLVTVDKPFRLGVDECSARVLLVGEQCQIEVRVAPEQPGPLKGTLQVFSAGGDPVRVDLKVVAADVVPAFLLEPSALDYAAVPVGQMATQKVKVSVPDGFRAVPKIAATVMGPDFTVANDGCATAALQAGQSCEIEIAFHPGSAGAKTGALSLSAPEPCPPFQSQVLLRGMGQ